MSDSHGSAKDHPGYVPGFADDEQVNAHIGSLGLYIGIFLALIFFTVVTVLLSYVHLGALNLVVAIFVATIKAALVVTFFMHLKDDRRFNALVFIGSLLFMGVFLAYTLNDTQHRSQIDELQGAHYLPATGEPAPGGRPAPDPAEAAAEHEAPAAGGEHH